MYITCIYIYIDIHIHIHVCMYVCIYVYRHVSGIPDWGAAGRVHAQPRFVVPIGQLLRMARVQTHEELKEEGVLVEFARAASAEFGIIRNP